MTQTKLPKYRATERRRRGQRGDEIIEFIFVMIPMFMMIFVYLDIAWAIFSKATLEQACRVGVRYGITNTVPDPNNAGLSNCGDLTTCVKMHVQWAAGGAGGTAKPLSGGLLGGSAGYSLIHVHYYQANGTLTLTDVTTTEDYAGGANAGQNVMVVSVNSYPLTMLVPTQPFYNNATSSLVTVTSADTISGVLTYPDVGPTP